jgi:hypothetical protein
MELILKIWNLKNTGVFLLVSRETPRKKLAI